jgi:glycosyltransferase involved in cell wall biosynthesis
VVGDGPARPELERLTRSLGVADRISFFGQQLDTQRFFCSADALVMSSTSEGLPMSLLQAMSIGLPAVLTDVGGMREVLRLSGGGLLTPVGDAEAMADAITKLATEPGLREEFRRRALEAYRAEFTLEQMDAAYMRLYRSARSLPQ